MSVRLQVASTAAADRALVWEELVDWVGQRRWIPLTTVRVTSTHERGLGVRVAALSGFWLGKVPIGLLDRFVVTGWTTPGDVAAGVVPPGDTAEGGHGGVVPPGEAAAELEVLHLGPYFTGVGVFRLTEADSEEGPATRIECSEVFDVVGGPLPTRLAQLALPLMRRMFAHSLKSLGALAARAG